ncbi:flagellar brake protein [Clostridium saccharobutylicum]|uniref:Flagellar brake protein YcgR n=1 Tax=Clostridium saccharobutylicum TaxID=169679 RepID=A0A1S8NIB2_CLOSA|nr:flagellar brake domain-containing protein [Clostridium saccharobutylicum]OOM16225.1 flagellar brake protein YcgR [Clostridium saccharobutylicum]
MHSFSLEVNDRIEVIVNEKPYKSLVIDVDDDVIKINLPANDGQYLMLHSGEKIEVNAYLENGNCFNFYSKVISKGKDGNILYYELEEPFNITAIQRRNFFRVGMVNSVQYKNITSIPEEDFENIPFKEALMVDLSGGGIKLKLKEKVNKDDLFFIKMKIKQKDFLLRGDIVRIEETFDNERLCGIRFLDITEAQSDIIIGELFEIMRKQRTRS